VKQQRATNSRFIHRVGFSCFRRAHRRASAVRWSKSSTHAGKCAVLRRPSAECASVCGGPSEWHDDYRAMKLSATTARSVGSHFPRKVDASAVPDERRRLQNRSRVRHVDGEMHPSPEDVAGRPCRPTVASPHLEATSATAGVVPLPALGYEAADHREGDLNQQGQEHDDEEPQQLPTTRAAPAV
jgi:hypothetical protein